MMMFISVLAKLMVVSKDDIIEKLTSDEDKLITNVLVDYKNREDMQLLKEQSILNDYVSLILKYFNKEKLEKFWED